MEISYLGGGSYKIKAKTGTVTARGEALSIAHKGGGEDFKIQLPGEYEIEGISVFGYKTDEETAYVIQDGDLRVLYLGNLTKALAEKTLVELENIDVVIFPADVIGSQEAVAMMAKLEPYYVLPFGREAGKFVAAYDRGSRVVKSLNLSKLGLPEDLTEVIVFDDKIEK